MIASSVANYTIISFASYLTKVGGATNGPINVVLLNIAVTLLGVLLAIFAVIKIEESSLADIINLSDFVNLGQIGSVIFFALLILTLFKFTIWYKDKNKAS